MKKEVKVYNKICIMVPTYGRHDTFLPRFINSIIDNLEDRSSVCFCFVVNSKDGSTKDAIKSILKKDFEYEIVLESLPNPHLSVYFNLAYRSKISQGDNKILSYVGDDMIFKTPGWDGILINTVNRFDGIGMFYCSGDERFGAGLCVNFFATRKMVKAWGNIFTCPVFAANGSDVVVQKAAEATGLDIYIEDIIIEHHQCSRDHVGWDKTYERLSPMRKLAIKNKDKEIMHARKQASNLRRAGFAIENNPIVPHLLHKRVGRRVIKDGIIMMYDEGGELIPYQMRLK